MSDLLTELRALDRETINLERTGALLSWDQMTGMPSGAVAERAEQLSLMQGLVHERMTHPRIGEILERLVADSDLLDEVDTAYVREMKRRYDKATRLPNELVRALAERASLGHAAWEEARAADDFSAFAPHLEKLIEINREVADRYGYDDVPYDALLDQFEPYARSHEIRDVFSRLSDGLVPLVQAIGEAEQVDSSFLDGSYPVDRQETFSRDVMIALGYDTDRGRLDRSAHPFTTTLGTHDVRITTRYDEARPAPALFSTIHETGHALYELGIDERIAGTVLAEGTSLGIHESQSRMWENVVGRSRSFWAYWFPRFAALFPGALDGVDAERFYRAVNRVEPSLIRVDADEVTYSLHVILRFELEQELINGGLTVSELPGAWNERSRALLGIEPPTDAVGVLQDVHWSEGMFGYFPTYALGNVYSAQFFRTFLSEQPDFFQMVERGNTGALLAWLRERIHAHGKVYSASDLVKRVTGESLNPTYFLEYIREKYSDIYRL